MDTSKLKFKAEIMDENAMKRALRRIAHEIIENNGGVETSAGRDSAPGRDAGEDDPGDHRAGGGR